MDAIDEGELVLNLDVPTLLGSNKERRNGRLRWRRRVQTRPIRLGSRLAWLRDR
jgi:hypothetical protein